MPINIDKKKFRKILLFEDGAYSMLPVSLPSYQPTLFDWSYDGEWIKLWTKVGGYYPAIRTVVAYQGGREGFGFLDVACAMKAPNDKGIYFFFYEPQKADFANYQGMDTADGTTYVCRSKSGAVETKTTLTGQNWTVERRFRIIHQKDRSKCEFYIENALMVTHTTNISDQPFEVCCAEPNATIREVYMRYPRGIYIERV